MNKLEKVREMVLSDLRSCYKEEGILASQVNFSDFWARDTFWACLGLIKSGEDLDKVKSSLELFLKYQKSNGKIPRKICLDYNALKYLGIKIKRKNPRPIYTSPIKSFFSMDDNLLLVIAFCEYVEKTKNEKFVKKYFSQIENSLKFYQNRKLIKENLLYEIGLGNWMDTVFKKGFVLYTNCLWYEAVKKFEQMTISFNRNVIGSLPKAEEILCQMQKIFWIKREKFFSDSVSSELKQQKYFDMAGNVLAVLFEIASGEQVGIILDKIEDNHKKECKKGEVFFHPTVFPRYPFWKINPVTFLFGIQNYQNGNCWSWIEMLLIIANVKHGRFGYAQGSLENISEVIIKNGHIYETYFLDGRPFDHLLWKSAVPFAWSAGLFLWAAEKFKKQ